MNLIISISRMQFSLNLIMSLIFIYCCCSQIHFEAVWNTLIYLSFTFSCLSLIWLSWCHQLPLSEAGISVQCSERKVGRQLTIHHTLHVSSGNAYSVCKPWSSSILSEAVKILKQFFQCCVLVRIYGLVCWWNYRHDKWWVLCSIRKVCFNSMVQWMPYLCYKHSVF